MSTSVDGSNTLVVPVLCVGLVVDGSLNCGDWGRGGLWPGYRDEDDDWELYAGNGIGGLDLPPDPGCEEAGVAGFGVSDDEEG